MDAAGKDGTIKHVMSGVNPQGVRGDSLQVARAGGAGSRLPLAHQPRAARRGRIGIFNRSHYEEVLVVRVHPALLEKQRLPVSHFGKRFWAERLDAIAAHRAVSDAARLPGAEVLPACFEGGAEAAVPGTIGEPEKNWKFSASDLAERAFWDDYVEAYEAAISATAAPHAPWYVVPADNKWFTRLVVVAAMNEALDALDLKFPTIDPDARATLNAAREKLDHE